MQLISVRGSTGVVFQIVTAELSIRHCIYFLMVFISWPALASHTAWITIQTIPRQRSKGDIKVTKQTDLVSCYRKKATNIKTKVILQEL